MGKYLQIYFALYFLINFVSSQCLQPSTVTVIGQGFAQAIPDTAVIYIALSSIAATAVQSSNIVRDNLNQVLSIIDFHSIHQSNIQVININLSPIVNSTNHTNAYNSTRVLSIKVPNIGDSGGVPLGEFLDQLSVVKNISLSGIRFDISNKTRLFSAARASAFRNARATAEMFANLGGFRLQSVRKIVQSNITGQSLRYNISQLIGFKQSTPISYDVKVETTIMYSLG